MSHAVASLPRREASPESSYNVGVRGVGYQICPLVRRRSAVRGLVLCILLSAAAGCRDDETAGSRAFVVAQPGPVLALDPALVTDIESARVATQVFESLVRYRQRTMEIEPALATRWSVSDDGRSWTFHLRRGVHFHDGTPLDADAVVFSFERQRDPNHPFHFQSFPYWRNSFRNIVETSKVDEYTVLIKLRRPFAPFLSNLSMFPASIVSPTAIRRYGRDASRHPVGTGPFRFVGWERGARVILERNPDYWERPPEIERLVFRVVRDARQRLEGLQSAAFDVVHGLAPEDRPLVGMHPQLREQRVSGNNVAYLAMNNSRPPFDDPRVRRAFNYAIDRQLVVKLAYQGLAVAARGPLPPRVWSYEPAVARYAHDPAKAKRMLREAGYDFSRTLRLYVMSIARPYLPSPPLVARMIARDLARLGIKVDLVIRPHGEHLRALRAGEHDLALHGWSGDNADPDNFLYVLLDSDNAERKTATNVAFFKDKRVHRLLTAAREEMKRKVRERYYREAQRLVAKLAPWVPLAHSDEVVALRRRVHHLVAHPSALISYRRVSY